MPQKTGTCAYCGQQRLLTSDHVPPKLLFVPAKRQNLITVPSCSECNGSFSKDDEYLRLVLSMRQDVEDGASGALLWEKAFRGLLHPEAAGLKAKVLSGLRRVSVPDTAGSPKKALAYEIDYTRLRATAQRIVRGLFYHQTKRPLAEGYVVMARFEEHPQDAEFLLQKGIVSQLSLLENAPLNERGDGTFRFKLVRDKDDGNVTCWGVQLLESLIFFGITFKPRRQLVYPHGRPL